MAVETEAIFPAGPSPLLSQTSSLLCYVLLFFSVFYFSIVFFSILQISPSIPDSHPVFLSSPTYPSCYSLLIACLLCTICVCVCVCLQRACRDWRIREFPAFTVDRTAVDFSLLSLDNIFSLSLPYL